MSDSVAKKNEIKNDLTQTKMAHYSVLLVNGN